jgi:hypothetical protein
VEVVADALLVKFSRNFTWHDVNFVCDCQYLLYFIVICNKNAIPVQRFLIKGKKKEAVSVFAVMISCYYSRQ